MRSDKESNGKTPSASSSDANGGQPIIVAVDQLVNGDVRPYRVPFLKRLAESGRVDLRVWHGDPPPNLGAPDQPPGSLPVESKRVVNRFWPGGRHRIAWQSHALGVLRSNGDVIVCAEVVHNLTVWLVAVSHRWFGKPLVLTGFFFRAGSRRTFVGDWFRRRLHRRADFFLPYTEQGRRRLIEEGVSPDRVYVSCNTLDTERLKSLAEQVSPADVEKLRSQLSLANDRVLLYLGRLDPVKRVDIAIDAVRHLPSGVSLVVVGSGSIRGDLEARAKGLPVHFTPAIYDEARLAPYMLLAELLVLPGRVGLTCVHGFAFGLPCVTVSGEVVEQSPECEYVESGLNGVIVESAAAPQYAAAIRSLLDDDSRLERLSQGAQATGNRLGMARMVTQFEAAVHAAANGST